MKLNSLVAILITALISIETATAGSIQLMSYNVENLFDTNHDEGKEDWSFLPKNTKGKKKACEKITSKFRRTECLNADWTEQKLDAKINNLVDVVMKNQEKLPDILALVEVENPNVVAMFGKKLGFKEIEMTDSPDNRGIDVALLFNTKVDLVKVDKKEHHVAVDYPTRNILEVEFLVGGYPLTVFVNHWPSLSNPDSWRIKAANVLMDRVKEIKKSKPGMSFIAVGDFNTVPENNPHPFRDVLHKDNSFLDAYESFMADAAIGDDLKKKMPKGSYFYSVKKQWNHLDRIFYSPNLNDKKDLDIKLSSFEIYAPDFATKEWRLSGDSKAKLGGYEMDEAFNVQIIKIPKRFNPDAKKLSEIGYSDHFPLKIVIEYPENNKKIKK